MEGSDVNYLGFETGGIEGFVVENYVGILTFPKG
jgi:hypothetical protein